MPNSSAELSDYVFYTRQHCQIFTLSRHRLVFGLYYYIVFIQARKLTKETIYGIIILKELIIVVIIESLWYENSELKIKHQEEISDSEYFQSIESYQELRKLGIIQVISGDTHFGKLPIEIKMVSPDKIHEIYKKFYFQ